MLTSAPFDGDAILPLADARVHLNLTADDSFHDAAVGDLRDAAIGWAESYTGRSLQARQFDWSTDQFASRIRLPVGPVSAIDAINYHAADGTDTALTDGDWYLGGGIATAKAGSSWPTASGGPGSVRVTFTAGYALPADIPPNLLASVKLAMSAFFEDRSSPDLTAAERVAHPFRYIL